MKKGQKAASSDNVQEEIQEMVKGSGFYVFDEIYKRATHYFLIDVILVQTIIFLFVMLPLALTQEGTYYEKIKGISIILALYCITIEFSLVLDLLYEAKIYEFKILKIIKNYVKILIIYAIILSVGCVVGFFIFKMNIADMILYSYFVFIAFILISLIDEIYPFSYKRYLVYALYCFGKRNDYQKAENWKTKIMVSLFLYQKGLEIDFKKTANPIIDNKYYFNTISLIAYQYIWSDNDEYLKKLVKELVELYKTPIIPIKTYKIKFDKIMELIKKEGFYDDKILQIEYNDKTQQEILDLYGSKLSQKIIQIIIYFLIAVIISLASLLASIIGLNIPF